MELRNKPCYSFGFLPFLNKLMAEKPLIEIDREDIDFVLSSGEFVDYSCSIKWGPYRGLRAGADVTENLERDYKGILFWVTGSSDLELWEVNDVAEQVCKHCEPDANIVFGAIIDENLHEQVRVDVVGVR